MSPPPSLPGPKPLINRCNRVEQSTPNRIPAKESSQDNGRPEGGRNPIAIRVTKWRPE